jgi:site-specific recombinase XerD
MRIDHALSRFIVQLQADGRSPHTVAQYARRGRRFGGWLDAEHLPDAVAKLEPEHGAGFLASAEAQRCPDGRAKRTGSLNALRSSLGGFFEYTVRAGLDARSPAHALRMARVGATLPKMRIDAPRATPRSAWVLGDQPERSVVDELLLDGYGLE